jgi:hypothetical protein
MADHADDDGDNNVFVYMGGNQEVPEDVTHVRIHKSVTIIARWAFSNCMHLVSIEIHDGVEIIGNGAFYWCSSLRGINLSSVRVIEDNAFCNCHALMDVEFGDKLESIGQYAFQCCTSLTKIKLPKVRVIGERAFSGCKQLTEVELSKDLETIGEGGFGNCLRLRRIAIPLKNNLLAIDAFYNCDNLCQVDLVGGIHKTISSLLLDSWRNNMNDEINQINQLLPNTPRRKTALIQQWMGRVLERMDHYKSEHYILLKNNMTQLELALWDANLPNVDAAECRHEARVTCGANIIIPHVMSFLNNEEVFPTVRNVPL